MLRRTFLQHVALGSLCLQLPLPALAQAQKPRYLIIVQLAGGNDSLSSMVPYTAQAYYQARPSLAIPKSDVHAITASVGLHPNLPNLAELLRTGHGQIVQNIGYRQPNRSHFKSTDLWESGSDSSANLLSDGWYGRNPRLRAPGEMLLDAVALRNNDGMFLGADTTYLHIPNLETFTRNALELESSGRDSTHFNHLKQAVKEQAEHLSKKLPAVQPEPGFADTPFQRQLAEVCKMIKVGGIAPIYSVTLGGFDTHVDQAAHYGALMADLDQGLNHLIQQLRAADLWDQVTIMTYSEFGRRVAENGNGGTDHGAAASHFIFNSRCRSPVVGDSPHFEQLDQGDLIYKIHINEYYQRVLQLATA